MFKWIVIVAAFALLVSCKADSPKKFRKLAPEKTGLQFVNQLNYNDSITVLEFEYMFNGGGVGFIDINNDRLQDVIFTGNMVSNRLYLNKGNLQFEDITSKAGVATEGWSNGVAVVDINQDGWQDFYICRGGHYKSDPSLMRNLFFINNGNNTFTESAAKMGLAEDGYDIQAAFFDYDKDGDLDMYLLRNAFVKYNRNNARPKQTDGSAASTDKLFRHNGDLTFTDVSKEAGITIEGFGLGVNVCDVNNDNWPDVYVSNDFLSNDLLWINNQNGTFTNKAKQALRSQTYNGMGNDVADFNNDGLPEIVTLDMLPPDNKRWKLTMGGNNYDEFQQNLNIGYEPQFVRNTLQLNNGDGSFSEIGRIAGIHATEWSWSALFADYDNDGWKDLFITNGFRQDINNLDFVMYGFNVYGKEQSFKGTPLQRRKQRLDELAKYPGVNVPDYIYRNDRQLRFSDVSKEWGFNENDYSNGAAYGDLDNDGDLDLVINNLDGPSCLYENLSAKTSWLRIDLAGPKGNIDGIGTKVWLWQKDKMQFSNLSPYRGYLSTVENLLHFGIDSTQVDSLRVLWPDGKTQILRSIAPNKLITLEYKNADSSAQQFTAPSPSPFLIHHSSLPYKHIEDEFSDFKLQALLPQMHSMAGPGLAVGDVNGDGLEDLFAGGAANKSGKLLMQTAKGKFMPKEISGINNADNMGVLMFDADNDKDLDLYISAGGTLITRKNSPLYKHRLYLNDSRGNFKLSDSALPAVITPASSVVGSDYDRDGDIDLFICGRVSPAEYPLSPKSFLLRNDSKNNQCRFSDVTPSLLSEPGMVSSALWTDFDNDGWTDLILVGEFMPIRFFKNNKGIFADVSANTGLSNTSGWWNSIAGGDFDKDGDIDYIIGNLGLNGPYKASAKEPVRIYASDYDKDGKLDPIMCHYIDGKEYMVHSRDDINKQMTAMRGRFRTYDAYASATFQQAMRPDEISGAYVLKAERFESSYLENLGAGKFRIHALPLESQLSPLFGVLVDDHDGDGNLDALAAGNLFAVEVQSGRYDAQGTLFLKGDGSGNLQPVRSAIQLPGDNKSIISINIGSDSSCIIIGSNSDSLKIIGRKIAPRAINLLPHESFAMLTDKNGKRYKQEFYYGHTYLSQGSRTFRVPVNTKSAELHSSTGKTRMFTF